MSRSPRPSLIVTVDVALVGSMFRLLMPICLVGPALCFCLARQLVNCLSCSPLLMQDVPTPLPGQALLRLHPVCNCHLGCSPLVQGVPTPLPDNALLRSPVCSRLNELLCFIGLVGPAMYACLVRQLGCIALVGPALCDCLARQLVYCLSCSPLLQDVGTPVGQALLRSHRLAAVGWAARHWCRSSRRHARAKRCSARGSAAAKPCRSIGQRSALSLRRTPQATPGPARHPAERCAPGRPGALGPARTGAATPPLARQRHPSPAST